MFRIINETIDNLGFQGLFSMFALVFIMTTAIEFGQGKGNKRLALAFVGIIIFMPFIFKAVEFYRKRELELTISAFGTMFVLIYIGMCILLLIDFIKEPTD